MALKTHIQHIKSPVSSEAIIQQWGVQSFSKHVIGQRPSMSQYGTS